MKVLVVQVNRRGQVFTKEARLVAAPHAGDYIVVDGASLLVKDACLHEDHVEVTVECEWIP